MKLTKLIVLSVIFALLTLLTACQRNNTVCPPESEAAKPTLHLADLLIITLEPGQNLTDVEVQIGQKMVLVDKLISGPVCNDDWSGTVYVGCDALVAEAELDADANPLFFDGCNLNIETNTVVYVAAHNNEAFYKGCRLTTIRITQ